MMKERSSLKRNAKNQFGIAFFCRIGSLRVFFIVSDCFFPLEIQLPNRLFTSKRIDVTVERLRAYACMYVCVCVYVYM